MLLTFDCYGTLIDWETGIRDALRDTFPESAGLDDAELGHAFHSIQNRLKTSAYRSYRDLLTQAAQELANARGWDGRSERAESIPLSVPTWAAFPDTNGALERLRASGARLGILSNVDNDLLTGTLEHFTVPFDHLGTAESLRSYKPAVAHFELGASWARGGDWVHVAQSLFHDIVPATRLGVRAVWVNRLGEELPGDARPAHVAPDLASAADWLLSGESSREGR